MATAVYASAKRAAPSQLLGGAKPNYIVGQSPLPNETCSGPTNPGPDD